VPPVSVCEMIDPEDLVTRPLPHPTRLRFASADRIYNVMQQQDLLEDWTVVQSWGEKGNVGGGGKITQVASFEAGVELLPNITKVREKHGYLLPH
jgi:hypothetical protein